MKTIKLAHGVDRGDTDKVKDYKVITVKNSTAFHPGQVLDKNMVNDLCEMSSWDVTIVQLEEPR